MIIEVIRYVGSHQVGCFACVREGLGGFSSKQADSRFVSSILKLVKIHEGVDDGSKKVLGWLDIKGIR